MEALLTIDNLFTLSMLILLQGVLGFDNLLYISIESKRVDAHRQAYVRRLGIGLAIILRIALLFIVLKAVQYLQQPLVSFDWQGIVEGKFTGHSLIVLFGGAFIIYTAIKEIAHLLVVSDLAHEGTGRKRSVFSAVFWILIMNLVFSFDSILSAMALTDSFWLMAIAIIVSLA